MSVRVKLHCTSRTHVRTLTADVNSAVAQLGEGAPLTVSAFTSRGASGLIRLVAVDTVRGADKHTVLDEAKAGADLAARDAAWENREASGGDPNANTEVLPSK